MKRLMIAIFGMVWMYSASAWAQNIAWFNPAKVLNNSKEGKKVLAKQKSLQNQFEAERKKAEKPLEEEKNAIEQDWQQLQANASVLNDKEKQRRFEEIKKRYDEWMKKGYAFIIAHDPENPQILLFAKPESEITSQLIDALDAER